MIQDVQRIERAIKERRDIDVPLVNWWLYLLVLTPITCGVYPMYLFFKRTERVDKFIRRKKDYYLAILEFTEKYAEEINKYDKLRNEINDLKDFANAYIERNKEIGALKSFLLTIFTFGIYGFIYII